MKLEYHGNYVIQSMLKLWYPNITSNINQRLVLNKSESLNLFKNIHIIIN
jgi:hypothetical protein